MQILAAWHPTALWSSHLKQTVHLDDAMAERVFSALDFDHNGKIELEEWLRVYVGHEVSA